MERRSIGDIEFSVVGLGGYEFEDDPDWPGARDVLRTSGTKPIGAGSAATAAVAPAAAPLVFAPAVFAAPAPAPTADAILTAPAFINAANKSAVNTIPKRG